jgi:hypothetical protein
MQISHCSSSLGQYCVSRQQISAPGIRGLGLQCCRDRLRPSNLHGRGSHFDQTAQFLPASENHPVEMLRRTASLPPASISERAEALTRKTVAPDWRDLPGSGSEQPMIVASNASTGFYQVCCLALIELGQIPVGVCRYAPTVGYQFSLVVSGTCGVTKPTVKRVGVGAATTRESWSPAGGRASLMKFDFWPGLGVHRAVTIRSARC